MGILYIVATPIGNLEDITIRAINTLFSVDFIACEDTRRTGLLLQEIKKRFLSVIPANAGIQSKKEHDDMNPQLIRYDDNHEQSQTPLLIHKLEEGKLVALVSDAGTPLISDPGYNLVREAVKRGIQVVSIPGSTAAIAALSVSGLPTNNFFFLGYPPEKQSHRIKLFRSLSSSWSEAIGSPTIIFYCAPHKLQQTLDDMKGVFGDIDLVIARELTKVHEEVWRGKISKAQDYFSNPQGEFVVLFHTA
ncbi:MAG: 16S rRNA (cytidine(1402)-2'-O)-methyltransferase [Patescibacteria group bacterium]